MMGNWWNEIEQIQGEMDSLFKYLYRNPSRNLLESKETAIAERGKQFRTPMCEMNWTKNNLLTVFELPGVDKKDIELNVTDDFMEVKVDKKTEIKKEEKGLENFYSSRYQFYRQVPLPEMIDAAKVNAEFNNGLLKIEIPKKKDITYKTKRIDIK